MSYGQIEASLWVACDYLGCDSRTTFPVIQGEGTGTTYRWAKEGWENAPNGQQFCPRCKAEGRVPKPTRRTMRSENGVFWPADAWDGK